MDLIFTRDRAFYFTTVFIPGIILVTSSFITFWLEWNAVPARVMIGKRFFSLLQILKDHNFIEKEKLKKKGRGEMHLLFAEENFHHPISGEFSFGGEKERSK